MNNELDLLRKYRIGVLAGGSSSEREISLKSGKAVFEALSGLGLDVMFIDLKDDDMSVRIDEAGMDVAFIALHGRSGEDGTIQRILAEKNIPYTGSGPESSRMALDKVVSKEKFAAKGLGVPEYRVLRAGKRISFRDVWVPCVVKPRYEGSSIGLSMVFSESRIDKAVDEAFAYSDDILVEKFVPGRELTVGVLGDGPLPVVEIRAENGIYDFNAKYQSANTEYIVPAKIDEKDRHRVQEAGLRAHRALGCEGFSRVDMRFTDEGEIFILEVNTIPGLTERSLLPMAAKAAGLDFSGLCVRILVSVMPGTGSRV